MKTTFKKIISLIALSLMLTACGGPNVDPTSTDVSSEPTSTSEITSSDTSTSTSEDTSGSTSESTSSSDSSSESSSTNEETSSSTSEATSTSESTSEESSSSTSDESSSSSYDDSSESSSESSSSSSSSDSSSTSENPDDLEAYYVSIKNQTGEELRSALNSLNKSKKKKNFKYEDIKTYSKYIERPATGDDVPADKMVGFYDNALVSAEWDNQATWNREHVWPKSLGGSKVEGDLFMTRPASVKINSERGNKHYGDSESSLYDAGQYVAEYRGIAARIIFYCSIADLNLKVTESTTPKSGSNTMGKLSDLLKWNLAYLPSTADDAPLALRVEQNRNDVVQKQTSPELQGNRNPFVDHPEYACRIWGRTNDSTKQICGITD